MQSSIHSLIKYARTHRELELEVVEHVIIIHRNQQYHPYRVRFCSVYTHTCDANSFILLCDRQPAMWWERRKKN